MLRLSRFFRRQRLGIFALVLLETFFMVGGAEAVEARQQGILRAQAEDARMARSFGLTAAQWQVEAAPGWIERSAQGVADEAQEILDHSRTEVARLLDEIRGQDIQASLAAEVGQPSGSVDEELRASAAQPQRQIKPYIPRRSALEEGEGERTVARAPRSAKLLPGLGGSTEDDLPLRVVQRTAQTVEASALPAGQKISSAIAPASSPLTQPRGAKSNKAIAPEVVALAASLDNSPAKIFRYVHDQITYDPKWGVDSTPLGTLWEGRGTSWDQAWLLQELLIAAGIDARLEWGQVEIPPSLLTNLTGIDDPIRAGDFLTTAGLEVLLVIQGSQVSAARFPHVWVKAHLDYIPNRGATAGTADTWIRMDPSITTHERTDGLRLDQDVPFVLGDHLLSGTELSPRQDYEAALLAHVADQGLPVASLDDAKSLNRQVADDFPFVPGTLRAKIVSAAGESETVPAAFEQDVEVQIREEGGSALLTWTTTASNLYGKRLETVWLGATSSDQAALDLYGGIFATPPYEVELRPTLRLDGVEVASGTAIGSAEDAEIQLTLTPPDGSGAGDGFATVAGWDLFAGEHGVLTVDYGRAPPELADRFAQEALNAAGNDFETEGWQLAEAASTYLNALGGDLTHLVDLSWHRLLTFNTAVFAVKRGAVSTSPDGTPQTFSPGPLALDVGAMPLAVMPVDGVQTSTVSTLELLGSQGSFREGEALASVFGGEHLTAVTFLTRAVREGQVVTKVDLSNLDEALAAAEISSDAKGAIRFAVEQLGMEAWISETQIESNTFQTTGYILIDPATGSGGYFVTFERRFTPLDGAVTFHNPIDLDVITAPTDVIATIDAEGIESWTLSTRPVGGSGSTVIATGTGPVDNTVLGRFDPTLLLNGMHDIVLTGLNAAGEPVTGRITVVVEGQMKVGHFALHFVDLSLPVSGLQIEISRTYDTRDLAEHDFGFGWKLGIRQGSYRNNRPPGDGWQISEGFLPCEVMQETKSHLTTIKLSEQELYQFKLELDRGAPTLGGCFAEASFVYLDGPLPGSTLEILGNTNVFFANASNRVVDPDTQEDFVPRQVRLTTRDGRIFDLDLEQGVTSLEDRNGNELEITPDGIQHSAGRGIDFVRDGQGRITEIIDPLGNALTYEYDGSGDLVGVTDPESNTTQFSYDGEHRLVEILDSLGRRPVRTEYDADGRLLRQTDAFGRAIEFNHDLDNRRETIVNRNGGVRVMDYDARGNIVREIDPLGHETSRTFDAHDRIVSQIDPLGRETRFVYTPQGDLETYIDPLGHSTRHTYNERGQLLSIVDPGNGVTTFTYDDRGNLISSRDPAGSVSSFTHDSQGNLLTMEDALGAVTRFEYDGTGNRTLQVDAEGHETRWVYDNKGRIQQETRSRTLDDGSTEALVSSYVYDDLDREISATLPNGSTTQTAYDGLGNVIARTDAMGRTTTTEYDLMGRPVLKTFPGGETESWTYDAEGRRITSTDRAGRTSQFEYDLGGRLIRSIQPNSLTTVHAYDAANQLISTTDPLGRTTQFVYDAAGRRTGLVNPLGQTITTSFDAKGNRLSLTDLRGGTTEWTYDGLNRIVETRRADGTTLSATYDPMGRRLTQTDAAGATTQFEYDRVGRLVKVTDVLGQETAYGYDEVHNRTSQVDALGRTTRLGYDGVGRLIQRTLPDGSVTSRAFNADGTLASQTGFDGSIQRFEYDDQRRQTRWTYPGNDVRMTYTATGQLATSEDALGVTSYSYDSQDRLISKSDPRGYELRYGYDVIGNQTSFEVEIGGQVYATGYTLDDLDRIVTVTDLNGGMTQLGYDANGNVESLTHPNGIRTLSQYDPLNRLTEVSTQDAQSGVLFSEAFTLAATGHREAIEEHDGTVRRFTYDGLYRLTGERIETLGGVLQEERSYTYDAVGNRLQESVISGGSTETRDSTYDTRDRLLNADGTDFSWNANGNLTAQTGPGDRTLTWDVADRLVSATLGDGTQVDTTYDPEGHRVRAILTAPAGTVSTVDYLVDTSGALGHVVAEIVDGIPTVLYTRVGDQLLSLHRPLDGTTRYFHADGLGSIRLLTDAAGAVTDRYEYSAFGELIDREGVDPNPYLFAGESFDAVIGLYFNRARWMDPETGRFVSSDPLLGFSESPMTLHRYLYALMDPVNRTDPSGEFSMGVSGVMVAATIGGILGGIDAHLSGNNPAVGFAIGFLVTAVATPLVALIAAKSVFAASALLVTGFFFGGYGIGVAIREGNFELAVFRGATMVFGTGIYSSLTRGAVPAAFGRLRFIGSDRRLARAAMLVKPVPGKLDVVVHGGPNSVFVKRGFNNWVEMSHRSLATLIRKSGPKPLPNIRLISCQTGSCPNGFAKNLANKLGVEVEAPTDTLWIHPNGQMTIGPTANQNTGQWVTFKPGKGNG